MPSPVKPKLNYSYTAFQQAQGNNLFPGTQLDSDLANIVQSLDQTIDFTQRIIRSDGRLKNGVVTKDSLGADVLIGIAPPRPWTTATAYALNDTATTNNGLYIALKAHVSDVFVDDLNTGKWANLAVWSPLTEISDNTVTEPKHATGAVSTRALADVSVTTVKLGDAAVTPAKLAPAVQSALLPIGATLEWDGPIEPAGWAFKFGQAVSRVTHSALMTAITANVTGTLSNASQNVTSVSVDLRNRGLEGAKIEGSGIAPDTTVSSVTLDTLVLSANAMASASSVQIRIFPHGNGDGSTTFNVPNDQDAVSVGRGNMGGVAAGKITTSGAGNSGLNTARLGAAGGVDRHAITLAQVAAHAHAGSIALNAGSHAHTQLAPISIGAVGSVGGAVNVAAATGSPVATSTEGPHFHSLAIVQNGGGEAHPNVQPSRVTNKIIFTGVV